jgi:DNA-binding NtrC family response regulator
MVVASPAMREVAGVVERIAPTTIPVLITGESGTGKELLARAIHRLSARSKGPFAAENCAAIPEALAESELFGYAKGAFAGADRTRKGRIETASGGTLFLDEIGDLSGEIQAKMLRALSQGVIRPLGTAEPRSVDIRLIAATGRDLRAEIERGAFRPDLFYRILGVEIRLPPLRDRSEDILPLVEHFFRRHAPRDKLGPRLTAKAQQILVNHAWPGNVRELENEVRRLVLLGDELIEDRDLRIGLAPPSYQLLAPGAVRRYSLAEAQGLLEREYLEQALRECGGVISRVAKLLGVNRRSVYKMIERLGLQPPQRDSG